MELVQPIRSRKKIDDIKKYKRGSGSIRNLDFFIIEITTAFPIHKILTVQWGKLWDFEKEDFFPHIRVKCKGGRYRTISLNKNGQQVLAELQKAQGNITPTTYVFASREGNNKPISRVQANNIIKDAARAVGIMENIGTHSLRKTFGYHAHRQGISLATLAEIFGHRSQAVTKRYLGLTQDTLDEVYQKIEL